ncbi:MULTISPECIES: sigma-70 family RNA polymerase sigma factor [unclassified Microcoleus]|uniref:sigma-70 family RNA polymerase sigma factor n=1 Tax=unclassified Microcoleus TaxID=2642155 RepID=UPI002FCFC1AC
MTDKSNPSEGEDHLSEETDAVGCSVKSEKFDRDPAHQQIVELVTKACQHPPGSIQRGRFLHRLILEILKSGKLWKEHTPYYKEALNKTWIYLSRNLCEATTAKRPYDPEESLITTWLNPYLQKRLLDYRLAQQKEQQKQKPRLIVSLEGEQDEENVNSIEKIPAEADSIFYVEEVIEWIETDPNNELKSRHIRGKPQINCQVLLQRKCLYGQSFKELAKEFGCAHSTLYQLFNNDCRYLLQKFCEDQGYQTLNIPGVYQNNEP